ncbi:interleukin-1 receptor-like 1 isoform X2 [Melanotaenia boesemani]|nr:interleukin-1 receptor-like 1 isoform X2 [Melanotaenia boesemani]
MVVLRYRGCNHSDTELLWKKDGNQEMHFYNMSADEQRKIGVLVYRNSLLILNASVNHRGNYSCGSLRNTINQARFMLTVYTKQPKEYEERGKYPAKCYKDMACTLTCPDVNLPAGDTPNITERSISWTKEDGESPKKYLHGVYFASANVQHTGVYTCTRSYMYYGQIYNMTFTVQLQVKNGKLPTYGTITSPKKNQVFEVELGTTVMIDCNATMDSCEDLLFWLSGESFVNEADNISRVFYNWTCNEDAKKMRASLVFREVLEEDLSKNYTCKFQSDHQRSDLVSITITKKAHYSYSPLACCIITIVVVIAVTVVIHVKFKVDIALFLRDSLGCRPSTSDGKSYDAFLMCYKSNTNGGLNEEDRKWLENILEEKFSYNLCLFDRDVLPGKAVAEAVLDCIEQSRTVILVPSPSDPELGSSLLSAIHAALVERQTRLIFINTEQRGMSKSGSLPEALQILSEAGKNCVTWKGRPPSSYFWKQLRYRLPAPQFAQKMSLLP